MKKPSDASSPAGRGLVADRDLRGLGFAAAYSDAVDTWMAELLADPAGIALLAVGA